MLLGNSFLIAYAARPIFWKMRYHVTVFFAVFPSLSKVTSGAQADRRRDRRAVPVTESASRMGPSHWYGHGGYSGRRLGTRTVRRS